MLLITKPGSDVEVLQYLVPLGVGLGSYLIGSLSFAVIVSKLMGLQDPRTFGSKNPGATNVLRTGNKAAAALTLLLDAAKGWLPPALVVAFGSRWGLDDGTAALAGLGAFLGHVYPLFFRFMGGKGVATALGVLLGLHPVLGLAAAATWLIVAYFFRISSLAALCAAVFAPAYYVFGDGVAWYMDKGQLVVLVLMSALLVYRHAANIGRLLRGTEPRIGGGKGGGDAGKR